MYSNFTPCKKIIIITYSVSFVVMSRTYNLAFSTNVHTSGIRDQDVADFMILLILLRIMGVSLTVEGQTSEQVGAGTESRHLPPIIIRMWGS